MTQGDELRGKLENVLAIIRESENNFIERTSLEAQLREMVAEKVALSFDGGKGKAKLMFLSIGAYMLVLLFLATLLQGLLGSWIMIAIAAAIAFVGINKHPVIAFIAGVGAVLMTCNMIYYCVIIPTIGAFTTGNIPAIIIILVMAAILIGIIYAVNHRVVRTKNAKIREANEEIMANNAYIVQQLRELYARAAELDQVLRSQLTPHGFYPQSYAYEDAAAAFVMYMKNLEHGTQVTMSVLMEMYKKDIHRQQQVEHWRREEAHWKCVEDLIVYYGDNILQNQEQIKQSLHFQNIISLNNAVQLAAQNERLDAISSKLNNRSFTGTIYIK